MHISGNKFIQYVHCVYYDIENKLSGDAENIMITHTHTHTHTHTVGIQKDIIFPVKVPILTSKAKKQNVHTITD